MKIVRKKNIDIDILTLLKNSEVSFCVEPQFKRPTRENFANSESKVLLPLVSEIRQVRKTQDQNPEFGPKPGEIQKNPAKKYISLQRGLLHIFSVLLHVQFL